MDQSLLQAHLLGMASPHRAQPTLTYSDLLSDIYALDHLAFGLSSVLLHLLLGGRHLGMKTSGWSCFIPGAQELASVFTG